MHNAWVLTYTRDQFDGYVISREKIGGNSAVREGDGLLLVSDATAFAVARVYRVKETASGVVLYLDLLVQATAPAALADLGITTQADRDATRLEWNLFEQAVVQLTGDAFNVLSTLSDKTTAERAYVRELLRLAVVDDLLGPANGPHEGSWA